VLRAFEPLAGIFAKTVRGAGSGGADVTVISPALRAAIHGAATLEFRRASIGRLLPGESGAFSTVFTQFLSEIGAVRVMPIIAKS
jgi:hypothetical protein